MLDYQQQQTQPLKETVKQRRMAPVRNLVTLYDENQYGGVGTTVTKIRVCGSGYEFVSKKDYKNIPVGLWQLVRGFGKFIEYNRVYPELEARYGIQIPMESDIRLDVESLVRVSSSTSDDVVYGVGEFKAMSRMFHKYCAGTMLIREICKWYENARKWKWLKINAERALKHRMRVCFKVWTSQNFAGARLVPVPPKPKTRRAGVKKRNKKSAAAVASPLPIVDEDEELVLEANEPQRIVQNLSELAISVDAALDGDDDTTSVVQSSVASAQACIVCFENAMEAACIPCGHRCLCVDCADRFRHPGAKCPVCRIDLLMVVKIWG